MAKYSASRRVTRPLAGLAKSSGRDRVIVVGNTIPMSISVWRAAAHFRRWHSAVSAALILMAVITPRAETGHTVAFSRPRNSGSSAPAPTESRQSWNYSPALAANVSMTAIFGSRFDGRPCRSFKYSGLLYESQTFP